MQYIKLNDAITSDEKVNALLGDFLTKQSKSQKTQLDIAGFNSQSQLLTTKVKQEVVVICKDKFVAQDLYKTFRGVKGVFTANEPLCLTDALGDLNKVLGGNGQYTFRAIHYNPEVDSQSVLDDAMEDIALRANSSNVQIVTSDFLKSLSTKDKEFLFGTK